MCVFPSQDHLRTRNILSCRTCSLLLQMISDQESGRKGKAMGSFPFIALDISYVALQPHRIVNVAFHHGYSL
jgi:hypothetical protein